MTALRIHPVLLVDSSSSGSPSGTLFPRLALGLRAGPFQPTLACFGRPSYARHLRPLGLTVHTFPRYETPHLPLVAAASLWLGLLARRSGARIVHTFGTAAHAYGSPATRLAGNARELWQIEDPPPCCSIENPDLSALERAALAVPQDRVVALSPSLKIPFGGALTCPILSILEKGQLESLSETDDEILDREVTRRVESIYAEML